MTALVATLPAVSDLPALPGLAAFATPAALVDALALAADIRAAGAAALRVHDLADRG